MTNIFWGFVRTTSAKIGASNSITVASQGVAGRLGYADRYPNGAVCSYTMTDGVNFESGFGTFDGATVIQNTTVLESSNFDGQVNWANTDPKQVYVTPPGQFFSGLCNGFLGSAVPLWLQPGGVWTEDDGTDLIKRLLYNGGNAEFMRAVKASGALTLLADTLRAQGAAPLLELWNTGNDVNMKRWQFLTDTDALDIAALTDAGAAGNTRLRVKRAVGQVSALELVNNGSPYASFDLAAKTLQHAGNVTIGEHSQPALYFNGGAGTPFFNVGSIVFQGRDDTSAPQNAGAIQGTVTDAAAASFSGRLQIGGAGSGLVSWWFENTALRPSASDAADIGSNTRRVRLIYTTNELNVATTGTSERALVGTFTNAAYTGDMIDLQATRAPSTAFNFLVCSANGTGDVTFRLRGDGQGEQDGSTSWSTPADFGEYKEHQVEGVGLPIGTAVVWSPETPSKVRAALPGETPMGIVRPKGRDLQTIVANAATFHWAFKYLRNPDGTWQWETVEILSWDEEVTPPEVVTLERVKRETVTERVQDVVIEDGQPVYKWVDRTREVDAIEMRPILDEQGRPILDGDGAEQMFPVPVTESYEEELEPAVTERRQMDLAAWPAGQPHPEGATVTEITRKKLNPEWDPDADYENRDQRPDWLVVGFLGEVVIAKGQPTAPGWWRMDSDAEPFDATGQFERWFIVPVNIG